MSAVTESEQARAVPVGGTVRFPRLATMHAEPLMVTALNCDPLHGVGEQALGLNYWFEPPASGQPERVTIRFTGTRMGVPGRPGPADRFKVDATVGPVLPDSGPIAVTSRIEGISAGRWRVTARFVSPKDWRPRQRTEEAVGDTVFAPVARTRAPGVRLGAWPAMVGAGAALGLIAAALMLSAAGLPVSRLLATLAVACVAGLAGARIYFLLTHRNQGLKGLTSAGMSIQGFVLASVTTIIAGVAWQGLAVGAVLDLVAPGMLLGMAVGRFGCLLGGCCTGRPTCSRWAVWSSDQSLGTRRIPVQILESMVAAVLAAGALAADWVWEPRLGGAVFATAIGLYVIVRQGLFRLRNNPHTPRGRRVAGLMATAAILTVIAASLAWCTSPLGDQGASSVALACVAPGWI